MDALESKEEALSNNLSSISEQIANQRAEEAAATGGGPRASSPKRRANSRRR